MAQFRALTGQSINGSRPERLGVAGSGAIACGLAAVAARGGPVVLWARSERSAEKAAGRVATLMEKCGWEGADRLEVTTDHGRLCEEATFLVEAIVEDRDAKCALLDRLRDRIGEQAVLATTTSSLSVEDLAAASGRPDRFAGLHVFNPVEKMELVELAFPPRASDDTRRRFRSLCEALGKTPVEVPDRAGFVVNRLLFPYLFDAVRVLEQTGLEPAAVDACLQLGAGHPMGPLALLDLVGLDVAQSIGRTIGADVPERIDALVAEGALGRKTGRGFYAY
jgi:3-hydroxybutyryl-CoA dehydrogenase